MKRIVYKIDLVNDKLWKNEIAHENTVPRPAMKKKNVRL